MVICWLRGSMNVWRCTETPNFSALNALPSATFPLPFTPGGSDISEQLEAHRHLYPGGDLVVSYDGKRDTDVRSLISRAFTPSRLKANEDFMKSYASQLVSKAAEDRQCELVKQIAEPFVTLVIADLQGVPAEDRSFSRRKSLKAMWLAVSMGREGTRIPRWSSSADSWRNTCKNELRIRWTICCWNW